MTNLIDKNSPYDAHWNNRKHSSGPWKYKPRKQLYLERYGPRLAFLCIVGLAAIAAVSWGWPVFVDWLIGDVGVVL